MSTKRGQFTYDRYFGENIRKDIRDKLEERQKLQKGANFGKSNATDSSPAWNSDSYGFRKAELSSKIPWARMWTMIEEYAIDPPFSKLKEKADDPNTNFDKWNDEFTVETIDTKIYGIGNTVFDDYFGPSAEKPDNVGRTLRKNIFFKPNAGITSINTSTSGYMGAINETVINFIVHNYWDFENIFVPYFMVPGARIFVDYGWNTSSIYNPVSLIKGHNSDFKSIKEELYGVKARNIESKDGVVTRSNGDMDVLQGRVTKFDSKINDQGSFECTVTIVSENYALLDYNQKTGLTYSKYFENIISKKIYNLIKKKYDFSESDLKSENIIKSDKIKRVLPLYVGPNQFVNFMSDEKGPSFPLIPEIAYESGIFYKPLDDITSDEVTENINALSTSNQT